MRWIEKNCRVPGGVDVGKPVKLRPWQRRLIKAIYDNPAGTRRAIISFGRKNGKTALAAFLLLVHLCGLKAKPNSNLYSAAQSKEQAGVLFDLAAKTVRMSPTLSAVLIVRDRDKELFCPELGTKYRALSAEVTTAHGLSPAFIVHDELGQVRGPRSALYDALETAVGAHANPLSVIISTQAPTDADLFSILIDDAKKGNDPRVVCELYTAPKDADPFALETIKMANPALGDFLNETEALAMADDARRMPAREPEYRNLILNQRVERVARFVDETSWDACGAPPAPLEGVDVYAGLDLSQVRDLTAFVAIGKVGDVWQAHSTFWLPDDELAYRAQQDRVPYDLWNQQGHLATTPGRTVDYAIVAQRVRELCDGWRVKKIAFDAWNFPHLKPHLLAAGFSAVDVGDDEKQKDRAKFVEFRQGYKSMSPALKALAKAIADRRLAHGGHPVLKMCAANAVLEQDHVENWRLNKIKSTGRIDGIIALSMAFGVTPVVDPPAPDYEIFFVGGRKK